MRAIEGWEVSVKSQNKLNQAMLTSVLFVARYLLVQKAVLLLWVCQIFLNTYGIQCDGFTLEVGESNVMFSSRWLLHQLIFYLDFFMMHRCVHMKIGIVLYCKGSDLLVALSWALSSSQTPLWSEPNEQQLTQHPNTGNYTQHLNAEKTLKVAGIIINNLIHDEIQRSQSSVEFSATIRINLSATIRINLSDINLLLLEFLTSITNTVTQREVTSATMQIKITRIFFILCQLMLCANPQYPTPIHDLIADTVEICGGSRQLMRILNRLGCASSPDTHDSMPCHG